jgi:hypothetical protein
MSLTSLLKKKDVRLRFREEFKKPRFSVKKEILAEPLSARYGLVGTAFDYLMRFYIERLNSVAISNQWVAESYIKNPNTFSPFVTDSVFDSDTKEVSYNETELGKKARAFIEQAKINYSDYLSSGQVTDQLLESTLLLAQIEMIFRSGRIDDNFGISYKEDVEDLQNLVEIIEPEQFRTKELCLLNPTFGEASDLVGGADADLLIDETLIDIKTTKNLQLKRDDFDQILGYVVLHNISSIGDISPKPRITNVAIYFSRHAYLHVMSLRDIINNDTFRDFSDWFVEEARN